MTQLPQLLAQLEATCSYCYGTFAQSPFAHRSGTSAALTATRKRVQMVLDEPHAVCGLVYDLQHSYAQNEGERLQRAA